MNSHIFQLTITSRPYIKPYLAIILAQVDAKSDLEVWFCIEKTKIATLKLKYHLPVIALA